MFGSNHIECYTNENMRKEITKIMKKVNSLTLVAIIAIIAVAAIMLYFINSHGDDIHSLGCDGKVTTIIEKNGTKKVVTEGGCEATR